MDLCLHPDSGIFSRPGTDRHTRGNHPGLRLLTPEPPTIYQNSELTSGKSTASFNLFHGCGIFDTVAAVVEKKNVIILSLPSRSTFLICGMISYFLAIPSRTINNMPILNAQVKRACLTALYTLE